VEALASAMDASASSCRTFMVGGFVDALEGESESENASCTHESWLKLLGFLYAICVVGTVHGGNA
jgi:hypothetical protein